MLQGQGAAGSSHRKNFRIFGCFGKYEKFIRLCDYFFQKKGTLLASLRLDENIID
jgi:hypothetical protein